MPSVIRLHDCLDETRDKQRDLYFLVKEEDFPANAVYKIQYRIEEFIKVEKTYTREKLIEIAEDVIEEYKGTIIPFKLYDVSY